MVLINAYHYAWSLGNSAYACPDLVTAWKNGVTSATLAFVISDSSNPLKIWSQITACFPDIASFIASGGYLIISCGGANGPYMESTMTEDQQFNALDQLIQATSVSYLDFDVEGGEPSNISHNQQRANVIKRLQAKYPNLKISFTIAVLYVTQWQQAIQSPELALIYNAIQSGVVLDRVNAMVMDCGYDNSGNWGGTTQGIIESMKTQLGTFYPSKSSQQLYGMIGVTPMIGKNDNGSTFTLQDAQTVAIYAKQKGIGMISYWALQRDQASQGGLAVSSMIQETNFQFYNIFKSASGGTPTPSPLPTPLPVPPTPLPTPTPVQPPAPAPKPVSPTSGSWAIGSSYIVGSQVSYNGHLYKCQIAHTSIASWDPPDVPALWIDLGTSSVIPKEIQVQLPFFQGKPKDITMNLSVTFDSSGNPTVSVLNSHVDY